METYELEDSIKVIHGSKDNNENLEENNFFDRNESLFGLTKSNRICESCEKFEKCMSLGQSVRKCQACAKRKDLIEKKPLNQNLQSEEMIGEERLEMEYINDNKDEPLIVATSKFVVETLEDHWNENNTKISCNENFAIEHEHVDIHHGRDVIKASNPLNIEDGKIVTKKRECTLSNKNEYKVVNAMESTVMLKKEKCGYSKGRYLLEKDTPMPNEKKESETFDSIKTKEELELERRERGWIANSRNASHSKVVPIKNVDMSAGYSPGNERKERVKVKTLKEKPDTQRILGLVAKRSESRITSPTHKRDPNKLRDEEIEASYTNNMINNFLPSFMSHENSLETSKPYETQYKKSTTHSDNDSICDANERKTLQLNTDEEPLKQQQQPCTTQQVDLESKCSSPTDSNYYTNDNSLHGTQRILELLAKRNGSRVSSPSRCSETRIKESESLNTKSESINTKNEPINTKEGEVRQLYKLKKPNVVVHSSPLHDQQQESSREVISPKPSKITCNNNDLEWNNSKNKISNSIPNNGIEFGAQLDNTHQNVKPNYTLPSNTNCGLNNNPLYSTQQILGMIAQRSESKVTSPKQSFDSNIQEKSPIYVKENGLLKLDDTMEAMNVAHPSYIKENQDVIPSKTIHFPSTLNESNYKVNEDTIETQVHTNVDNKSLKLQSNQDFSRQNSPVSNFSTPSSTICHVNDNPLYGTKFESEPSNCTFNNANENHLCTLNPLLLSNANNLISKPLNNLVKEISKKFNKEECTTLNVKNSSEMTPLFKSAITTPICKSPDLSQEKNKTLFQIKSKPHPKEVEIVEEESFLTSTYDTQLRDIKKIQESNSKNSKSKDEKWEEKPHTLSISNPPKMDISKSPKDGLKKKHNEEEDLVSHYNLKVTSNLDCKNTSKGQIMFWPLYILFKAITYPFKLVWKLILFFVYILKCVVLGIIIKPFRMLKNITCLGIDSLRSRILKHSQSGCNIGQGYFGCGCATKTYILIVLASLLLPSLFDLDFYLVNKFIEGQVVIREPLNFDYTKEHPMAMVNLLPRQIIGKAKGYFPDKEVMTAHAFPTSHVYHMIVHLIVPESQYNQKIGMFQVVAETFSARGHSLSKASRASMLRYHSPLIKYIKSIIMGIPIVLGISEESQTLSIKVIEAQSENEYSPTASVCIEIEPKAGHLTGLGVPEIYHGELQVVAYNPYLREVARNWVWSLYVYSGLALFAFEALLVLCCCRRIFPQKSSNKDSNEELSTKEKKPTLEEGPKNIQTFNRLQRRHIYFPKSLPLALPSTSNMIECQSA